MIWRPHGIVVVAAHSWMPYCVFLVDNNNSKHNFACINTNVLLYVAEIELAYFFFCLQQSITKGAETRGKIHFLGFKLHYFSVF